MCRKALNATPNAGGDAGDDVFTSLRQYRTVPGLTFARWYTWVEVGKSWARSLAFVFAILRFVTVPQTLVAAENSACERVSQAIDDFFCFVVFPVWGREEEEEEEKGGAEEAGDAAARGSKGPGSAPTLKRTNSATQQQKFAAPLAERKPWRAYLRLAGTAAGGGNLASRRAESASHRRGSDHHATSGSKRHALDHLRRR